MGGRLRRRRRRRPHRRRRADERPARRRLRRSPGRRRSSRRRPRCRPPRSRPTSRRRWPTMDAPDARAAALRRDVPPARRSRARRRLPRAHRGEHPRGLPQASPSPDARVLLFDEPGMPTWRPKVVPVAKIGADDVRGLGAHCAELVCNPTRPYCAWTSGADSLHAWFVGQRRAARAGRRRRLPGRMSRDGRPRGRPARARSRSCARAATRPTASPTRATSGRATTWRVRAGQPGRAPARGHRRGRRRPRRSRALVRWARERGVAARPVRRGQRRVRRGRSARGRRRGRPEAPGAHPALDADAPVVDVEAGHMGVPFEQTLEPRGLHARALPVVHPLQHRRRLGRGAERGPVLGRLREDRGHGRLARVRDRRRATSSSSGAGEPRPGSRAARRRQRGHAGASSRAPTLRLHPRADARARSAPGRSPRRATGWEAMRALFQAGLRPAVARLYDPFDAMLARQGGVKRVDGGGHARPASATARSRLRRRGAAGRAPPPGRSTSCSHSRVAARALGGAMLVVIFEGSRRGAAARTSSDARPLVRVDWAASWEGEGAGAALARAPLLRQLPAGAGLRQRRLRRHDGGRRALVASSARSTRACGARSASTCS